MTVPMNRERILKIRQYLMKLCYEKKVITYFLTHDAWHSAVLIDIGHKPRRSVPDPKSGRKIPRFVAHFVYSACSSQSTETMTLYCRRVSFVFLMTTKTAAETEV